MPAPVNSELPLRDIHLPAPVSWWPPAPGWWLLAIAALLAAAAGWWLWRRWRRRRVLRRLEAELDHIARDVRGGGDRLAALERLSVLLRRACLSFYPRSDVASLTGERWLAFLNDRTGDAYDEASAALLTSAPYQRPGSLDAGGIDRLIDTIARSLPRLYRGAARWP